MKTCKLILSHRTNAQEISSAEKSSSCRRDDGTDGAE